MFRFSRRRCSWSVSAGVRGPAATVLLYSACWLALLACCWGAASGAAPEALAQDQAKTKRVLLLFTARPNLPVNVQWERGIRTGVSQVVSAPVAFECEHVDFDRLKSPEYRDQWMSLLRAKYESDPPEVIIPIHDLAAEYFATRQPELFPQSQVVFCSINEQTFSRLPLNSRMTGVLYRFDYQRTLEMARQLVPAASKVVVIAGASETDQAILRAAQLRFADQDPQNFTYWIGLPLEQVCARVAKLDSDHLILFLSFESDQHGQMSISTRDALQSIAASAQAPIFGLFDSLIGAGVVGGQMGRVEAQGVRAGTIAGRLLNGEKADAIPFTGTEMNRPVFDDRALQRWRISAQTLPVDAIVLHRMPTLWSRYGTTLVLIVIALGFQSVLIVGLLFNRYKRQRAQNELEEMLRFQTAFCEVSAAVLEKSVDESQANLEPAIQRFCDAVGISSCEIWQLVGDHLEVICQLPQDPQRASRLSRSLALQAIPALWEQLTCGESVSLASPQDSPVVATPEHEARLALGLTSGTILPLRDNQVLLGMILFGATASVASRAGRQSDRLGMLADVVAQSIARRNSLQAIAASRSEARRLAGNLLTAQEDERSRISREIHDDICQRLVAAVMQIRQIEQQADQPETVVNRLAGLRETVVKLSRDVQHLSRKLHPVILEELGLADAIRSECSRLAEAGHLRVDFRCLSLPEKLDKRVALCLYRIVQESLWNVVKHAETQHALVRLSSDAEALYLEVSDQGRGFHLRNFSSQTGLGIVSFKERVRSLGGKIEITSAPQRGTRIWITLPISEEES